jgi:acylphosphatase
MESPGGRRRLTAAVSGQVQGVGFRMFVLREGRRLGLAGWVRNRADGSVEVDAEGPEGALRQLEAALRRGPSAARVERVDAAWPEPTGATGGFKIR